MTSSRAPMDKPMSDVIERAYGSGVTVVDIVGLKPGYVAVSGVRAPPMVDGVKTDVFLLADHGWEAYANLIEARRDMVEKNPALIQKFIDASAIGCYHYLYGGDRKGAYALIRKDNPEMTDAKLDEEVAKLQELGMIDSGDARTKGIGALSAQRLARYTDEMIKAGVFKPGDVDLKTLATEQFVNKGVGLDLRAKLVK